MSKNFFGLSISSTSNNRAKKRTQSPAKSTFNSSPANPSTLHKEKDQVSLLYELGLLADSDKRARRRHQDKDKEDLGGAFVEGSHPKKSTHQFHANFIISSAPPLDPFLVSFAVDLNN